MRNLLLVFCVLFAGTSCNSSKNIAKLNDVKWVLQTMNGKEIKLSDQNSEVFIQFNDIDKRVNGRAGCNRFFGNYEMEDQKLKFLPMGATRMACPDMQLESEFFQMLDIIESYTIKDNLLTFSSKDSTVAVFKKAEEAK